MRASLPRANRAHETGMKMAHHLRTCRTNTPPQTPTRDLLYRDPALPSRPCRGSGLARQSLLSAPGEVVLLMMEATRMQVRARLVTLGRGRRQ